MRKSIERVINNISEMTGYSYIGKEIRGGKTFYVFQDQCDYINFKRYSSLEIRELAKEGR